MTGFRCWLHVPMLQVFLLIDSLMFPQRHLFDLDLLCRKVSIQGTRTSGVSGAFTLISCKSIDCPGHYSGVSGACMCESDCGFSLMSSDSSILDTKKCVCVRVHVCAYVSMVAIFMSVSVGSQLCILLFLFIQIWFGWRGRRIRHIA